MIITIKLEEIEKDVGDKRIAHRMDKWWRLTVSLKNFLLIFLVRTSNLRKKISWQANFGTPQNFLFLFVSRMQFSTQNVSNNEIILVLFYASHPTLIYFNSKIYYNNVIKLTNKICECPYNNNGATVWPTWRTTTCTLFIFTSHLLLLSLSWAMAFNWPLYSKTFSNTSFLSSWKVNFMTGTVIILNNFLRS